MLKRRTPTPEPADTTPAQRRTHKADGGHTLISWWADQAADISQRIPSAPAVTHAETGKDTPTTVTRRYTRGGEQPTLIVCAADLDAHSSRTSGKWIIAQSIHAAQHPMRHRGSQHLIPCILAAAGLFAALAALNHPSTSMRIGALIAAPLLLLGAALLARFRHRRSENIAWAADDAATRLYGVPAARRALHNPEIPLYRTIVHSWIEQRATLTPAARIRRLEARAGASTTSTASTRR